MTVRTFTLPIIPASTGTAQGWFTALPYLSWQPIAAGGDSRFTALNSIYKGDRLSERAGASNGVVEPGPYQGGNSQADIVRSGNGVAIDQASREVLAVNCGGHSGRQENSSFSLQLDVATPGWRRITNSTPYADLNWQFDQPTPALGGDQLAYEYWTRLQQVAPPGGVASASRTWNTPTGTVSIIKYPACAGDGAVSTGSTSRQQWKPWTISSLNDINDRPRTSHTAYTQWYTGGKVWFPIQDSVDEGTGPGHNVIMSFNMDVVRAGTIPRPFTAGRDGIWDYYRTVDEFGTGANHYFGSACLDSSTGKIWYHPSNEQQFIAVSTTGTPGSYVRYADPNGAQNQFLLAGSAICPVPGRRLWVVLATGQNSTNNLRVYDLDLIEAGTLNTTSCENIQNVATIASKVWNVSHTAVTDVKKAWGMVWYEPDKSFLLYHCDDMNDGVARSKNLRRLRMPLKANGTYDRANAANPWVCDEVAITGFLPDYVTNTGTAVTGGSFTRFNIINDMGNGEAMLISQGSWDTPCYVCRLPNTTLTGV